MLGASSWCSGTCNAPLYYIDLSGLTDDGALPTPTLAATVTDGYGHAYWDMTIDAAGVVYMADWYKIRCFGCTVEI